MDYDFSFLKNRQPQFIGESKPRRSAVCIPLIETPEGVRVLFEQRSEKVNHQPGDICFPGGGIEDGETPEEAAVREVTEELLVKPEQLSIIGPGDILTSGTAVVYCFIGFLSDYDGGFGRDEVEEVFTVPLDFFIQTEPAAYEARWKVELSDDFPFEKIHGGRNYPWRRLVDHILFYEYQGRVIWGMTAKMMHAFAELMRQ